jgi:hypothetical protein
MAITASGLPALLLRADDVWAENATRADVTAQVDIVKAIKDNQTARIEEAVRASKDRTHTITWINSCAPTVQNTTNSCTWIDESASTDSDDIALSTTKEAGFREKIDGFRSNQYEYIDMVARNIVARDKALAEAVAAAGLTFIEANLGQQTYDNQGAWTVSTTSNEIPANEWTASLAIKLGIVAKKFKFFAPYLISGENLYTEYMQARLSQANADGKGDWAMFGQLPIYFDLTNIDSANSPDYKTYMLDRGAAAFINKAYFNSTPQEIMGEASRLRFTYESKFIPGLFYDVEKTTKCDTDVYEYWKMTCKYGYFLNPTGCTATHTGILAFTKAAGV